MAQRAKSICRRVGCNVLIDKPGYCLLHVADKREPFKKLDERKSDEARRFYSGRTWTEASKRHRVIEPLCRRCKAVGRVVAGTLVHHNPPREELIARGLNPYDDTYLETLCDWHHLEELRKKRK